MFSTFLFLESYSFLSLCKRWKKGMQAYLLYVSHSALEPSSKSVLSCFFSKSFVFSRKKDRLFCGFKYFIYICIGFIHLLHRDGIYIFHITQCISRIYKKTSIVKVTNIPQQSKYIYSYIFVIFFKRAITVRI